MKTLAAIDIHQKRVLIREDFNVPFDAQGRITSDVRIKAALPTIHHALKNGAAVILMSHLGRPTEGQFDKAFSLEPVAKHLSTLLGQPVKLAKEISDATDVKPGEVVLLENVRFNVGEEVDDETLARHYASLCDVFVMDAFATAHRAQASTHAVAKFAPIACAGPLLTDELDAIGKALKAPEKPVLAIVGGSKVSTKLHILENLLSQVDNLILGGGIANTFLYAAGYEVGLSLYEKDLVTAAKKIMDEAKKKGVSILLPLDAVVAKTVSADATVEIKPLISVGLDDRILDVGPVTSQRYNEIIVQAKTIIWNGPVGVFELAPFANGTAKLANAIAASGAFSLAGGGDTIAAIEQNKIIDKISYISTAGGAFLELLEGKTLPGVAVLN